MIYLKGKKILFFAPQAFDYELEIKKELEYRGAEVELYNERPSNLFLIKALIRTNKKLIRFYTNTYFYRIIKKYDFDIFDYIFVLRGEAFSPFILKEIKKRFSKAYLILYLWDSIKNNNILDIAPFFNRVFSFDSGDIEKYPVFIFRPLYYLSDYTYIANIHLQSFSKALFVGTVHSNRYAFIKKIENYLKTFHVETDFYFYFPSKLLYFKKKFIDSSFRRASISEFYFKPLERNDLLTKIINCDVILDFQHPNQKGLTMRSIEALGAKKKLITFNKEIKKYNFYNKNNIFVIDDSNFSFDENSSELYDFIHSPFQEINQDIYYDYSISAWINYIFGYAK
jgi:hypothetical protein